MYIGRTPDGVNIELPAADLKTHGVILGRTGSGKSGLTVVTVEEAALSGASVVVFDPKGDLTNLALRLPTESEFLSWGTGADFARHAQGLADSGYGLDAIQAWKDSVDVRIYAPGKTTGGGKSISVFPTFEPPRSLGTALYRTRAARDVEIVLDAVGSLKDQYDPALVFLTEAVVLSWNCGRSLPVDQWSSVLLNPPGSLSNIGGMALNDFLPKRRRNQLARSLVGFRLQADRWLTGERFDFESIVGQPRPVVAVLSMRHLMEDDRLFFTSLMMNRLVDFMFATDATEALKLLVVLDEARGYLPPYPYNPPTKNPICTVLAQGRAQGIGMLIGTQNPMDLDYKALSNVGTWFVGRLRARDMQRDLFQELSSRNAEFSTIESLKKREFLLLDCAGGHNIVRSRHTFSYLRGPLGGNDLSRLSTDSSRRVAPCGFWQKLFS